ncbi:hypothetical protein QTI33_32205 [Variovorax sp. J22P271]|uniref:hypothetical protein n=1 Tax=Variovorax davisae TaxID=3053515 RepID=UPI002575C6AD|nr:hypothetical protein [Variovorax sp. J22P271]MDM0036837.1 hypothetical protein [Variovorax sp. J22P271]
MNKPDASEAQPAPWFSPEHEHSHLWPRAFVHRASRIAPDAFGKMRDQPIPIHEPPASAYRIALAFIGWPVRSTWINHAPVFGSSIEAASAVAVGIANAAADLAFLAVVNDRRHGHSPSARRVVK